MCVWHSNVRAHFITWGERPVTTRVRSGESDVTRRTYYLLQPEHPRALLTPPVNSQYRDCDATSYVLNEPNSLFKTMNTKQKTERIHLAAHDGNLPSVCLFRSPCIITPEDPFILTIRPHTHSHARTCGTLTGCGPCSIPFRIHMVRHLHYGTERNGMLYMCVYACARCTTLSCYSVCIHSMLCSILDVVSLRSWRYRNSHFD